MLDFVAFDIETTGLTPVVDGIVEIGAVRFRDVKIIDTFETLLNPGRPVSKGASAVNGITDEMVRGKPTIEMVLPELIQFIGDAIPVAHHAPFDVGFLSYEVSRLNLAVRDQPVLDTCAMARRLFPHAGGFSLENLALQAARGTLSVRAVTPLSLGTCRGAVMMEAYCHLRNGKRHFRLDRVVEIR